MSLPSDSSESSSNPTESDPRITEVLSGNSLNRLSGTTPSTPPPTSTKPQLWKPGQSGNPEDLPNPRKPIPSDEGMSVSSRKPQIWRPGQSGNPAGRPKGTKNQITIL